MSLIDNFSTLSFKMKCVVISIVSFPILIFSMIKNLVLMFMKPKFLEKDIKGKVVLITGGASGIGRGIAVGLAKKGAKIISWDMNEEGNKETARLITDNGGFCYSQTVDISNREMIYETAGIVKRNVGSVDILINNAGMGGSIAWAPHIPDDNFKTTMDVNFFSHTWTVNAFLSDMISFNSGHIIAISSLSGISPFQYVPYCTSKYAICGFMESLRLQMHLLGHSGIVTSVFCPSYIDTPLICSEEFGQVPKMDFQTGVDLLIDGILREDEFLIIPNPAKFIPIVKAISPVFVTKNAYRFLFWGANVKKNS